MPTNEINPSHPLARSFLSVDTSIVVRIYVRIHLQLVLLRRGERVNAIRIWRLRP